MQILPKWIMVPPQKYFYILKKQLNDLLYL